MTAQGSRLQRINNIGNHVAIRLLHDGTHIAGQAAYNKVRENSRLRLPDMIRARRTGPALLR
jgi:hypothetical protein